MLPVDLSFHSITPRSSLTHLAIQFVLLLCHRYMVLHGTLHCKRQVRIRRPSIRVQVEALPRTNEAQGIRIHSSTGRGANPPKAIQQRLAQRLVLRYRLQDLALCRHIAYGPLAQPSTR